MTRRFQSRRQSPRRQPISSEPILATEDVAPEPADCPRCQKPVAFCVCSVLAHVANRLMVVILQHPQEQDKTLGTARLTQLQLQRSILKVGLSWPNLKTLLNRRTVDMKRWAVLHPGSAEQMNSILAEFSEPPEIMVLDRSGTPASTGESNAALRGLEGIILLDGNWQQAKTLWWRNPWLLKAWRIALFPRFRSAYGALRREPRRQSVSTLEAAALCLAHLEKQPALFTALVQPLEHLVKAVSAPKRTAKIVQLTDALDSADLADSVNASE
ncbi:DTW domain-containing protein [Azospirillaceae bacterium]